MVRGGRDLMLLPVASTRTFEHKGWERVVLLHVGNEYGGWIRDPSASVQKGAALAEGSQAMELHDWTLFVREANGASLSQYISSVTFRLPPFKQGQSEVRMEVEPFQVNRKSWAAFEATVTIEFKGKRFVEVKHYLQLGPGSGGCWSDSKPSTKDDAFSVTHYVVLASPEPGP
mmetsp:Transcript_50311/g.132198  ORF Transcript_50311/g.132198 Transcript_50311/m.132198 type:complete len:173 (+) Transcript_50311:153-671(+)